MFCQRCGKEILDQTIICPSCGTASPNAKFFPQPPPAQTSYGPSSQQNFGQANPYQQGYAPQPGIPPFAQPGYMPPPQPIGYAPPYAGYAIAPASGFTISNKNNGALIAEIILSLFGIFGVGWLMAGETTAGIVLLICSVVLYWPFVILTTVFTLGLGLLCFGPLAIGAIILNAVLLNSTLDRKAAQFVVVPPPMPMPPYL